MWKIHPGFLCPIPSLIHLLSQADQRWRTDNFHIKLPWPEWRAYGGSKSSTLCFVRILLPEIPLTEFRTTASYSTKPKLERQASRLWHAGWARALSSGQGAEQCSVTKCREMSLYGWSWQVATSLRLRRDADLCFDRLQCWSDLSVYDFSPDWNISTTDEECHELSDIHGSMNCTDRGHHYDVHELNLNMELLRCTPW